MDSPHQENQPAAPVDPQLTASLDGSHISNSATSAHKLKYTLFGSAATFVVILIGWYGFTQPSQTPESALVTDKAETFEFMEVPPEQTYDRYARFEFDVNVAVECSSNEGDFHSCESPYFLPDVPEGTNTLTIRAVASQTEIAEHQWHVLDVFDKETDDLLVSNQTPDKAEPRSWRGIIRINCDFSHSSYNDPIIFPGKEGMAHLHRFYGNELVDHNTTLESLLTTGSSTCQGNALNRSAYWIPALLAPAYNQQTKERLLDEQGEPAWKVVPAVVGNNEEAHEVFYYSAGIDDLDAIQPIPVGLRMIAGEQATKSGREQDTSIVRWHCQSWESSDAGNPRWSSTIPECKAPDRVRMDIFFPSCWNGRDLDSPDHKSHMAYPVRESVSGDMVCPSSHPVALVRPSYHYAFGVLPDVYELETKSSRGWKVASDDYEISDTQAGGLTLHGDWWNGWHPTIMEAMLETCIQGRYDCHNGNLANGWRLVDTHKGVGTEPLIYNAGAGLHGAGNHEEMTTAEQSAATREKPAREKPVRN